MKLPTMSWQFCGLVCVSAVASFVVLRLLASIMEEGFAIQKHEDPWDHPATHLGGRVLSPRRRMNGRGIHFERLQRPDQMSPDCPKDLLLLILVTSAPWNSERRDAIRSTWAQQCSDDHPAAEFGWRVAFLIGQPIECGLYPHLAQEQQDHSDLLLGNYIDNYRNLTLKVMHGLAWAAQNCAPRFILKTDDDCFVNTVHLRPFLLRPEADSDDAGLYVGSVLRQGRRDVVRDQRSKWYVSKDDFWEQQYPPYASGIGYILSLDAAGRMVEAARDVPAVPMEDAYVGILAREVGVQVRDSGRFVKQYVKWRVCNYRYLMVIHHLDAAQQQEAQRNALKAQSECNHTTAITSWE